VCGIDKLTSSIFSSSPEGERLRSTSSERCVLKELKPRKRTQCCYVTRSGFLLGSFLDHEDREDGHVAAKLALPFNGLLALNIMYRT
jgi:hypothetical protein